MHSKPVWIYKVSKVYSKYIYFRFQAERKRAEFFLLSNDEAKRNRLLYLKIMSTQVTKKIHLHIFCRFCKQFVCASCNIDTGWYLHIFLDFLDANCRFLEILIQSYILHIFLDFLHKNYRHLKILIQANFFKASNASTQLPLEDLSSL